MASPANLCDRCHKNRAGSFRLTKTIKGNSVSRQYCERCAAELELSADDGLALALFPWEEAGPYQVSAETEVTNVQPERAALRVRHSSYYPVGTELFITPRYLPPGLRRTNKTVCFNLPLEHAKLFFPGSNPTAVGGSQDEQVGHRSVAFSATGIPGEWVKRRVDRKGLASLDSHIREAL